MASRPAAGGGVWVEVGPERFARWCDGFAQRHGGLAARPRLVAADASGSAEAAEAVELAAADGSVATCHVPFPPLGGDADAQGDLIDRLIAHAVAERTVGVLLVRRGGYAVGVFESQESHSGQQSHQSDSGPQGIRLTASKVGSRHVQGRSAAGGWSQQRFARRREGQAREAYAAAADAAARILLPRAADLDALVVGGDAGAISVLRTDVRLKPLWLKESAPFLNVGDPKAADLQKAPEAFRAVRIRLVEQS